MAVRDVVQAAAGVGGGGEYVEDVFSTYLYTGTNASGNSISNGINLSEEGGLVWIKDRTVARSHQLFDTERGVQKILASNIANKESTNSTSLTAFNTDGWTMGDLAEINGNDNYASWTFRKAPKFFDVVTYTGDGVAGHQIPHNLGSVPGCIIVKVVTSPSIGSSDWVVYHRSTGNSKWLALNLTAASASGTFWNNTDPTDTYFTLGSNQDVNKGDGTTYVAYLFAHDAGGFGDDGEQNVISCGSFTGNGSTDGPEIDLGFEPQWVITKRTQGTSNWEMFDSMRGIATGGTDAILSANTSNAEVLVDRLDLTATGFKIKTTSSSQNTSGETYIYIAIRRPMKTPESGTEVFAVDQFTAGQTAPSFISDFPVDMAWLRNTPIANTFLATRLLGAGVFKTNGTDAWGASGTFDFDYSDGWNSSTRDSAYYSWMFKRAPGFMDVVAYTGTGAGTQLVYHNLQVSPELVIIKRRDGTGDWLVNTLTNGSIVYSVGLNSTSADNASLYQGTAYSAPTYIGVRDTSLATISSATYIAYLFATLPGVSKVGSYTGTGADLNVDCGFSAGARFVLIKRTDSTGDWYYWDSARGIVSGNDPYLLLNSTAAQVTNTDYIDPLASGFTVTSSAPAALNASGGSYIFLAIA